MRRARLALQVTAPALMLGLLALLPGVAAQHEASAAPGPRPAAATDGPGEAGRAPRLEARPAATAESSCSTAISRTLAPTEIRSCERSIVSLHLRPFCTGEPMNVVLVLMGYASAQYNMQGPTILSRWNAAAIDALDLPAHPNVKVGLVYYRSAGTVLLDLTNDDELVRKKSRVQYVDQYYDPTLNTPAIFKKAADMLQAAGKRDNSVIAFIGAMWLSEDPRYPHYGAQYRDWFKAATIAKRAAYPFIVACPDWGCKLWSDWWTAASPGYFYDDKGFGQFRGTLSKLVKNTTRADLATVSVEDEWPAGVELVPDSAVPRPVLVDPVNRRLRWDIAAPITRPLTVTYKVAPLDVGPHTFSGGRLVLTDTLKLVRRLPLPTGVLTVTGPCITPTDVPTATAPPTPTSTPLPTDTPAPSATATPVPTLTPAPTATPAPRPAYLPVALGERCVPSKRRVDVALVIDASTSMEELVRPGWSKLDAARAAARGFLSALHLDVGDQAAIVAFNGGVSMLAGLTSDQAALLAALDRITVAPQTRIHLGVREAQVALAGPRHRPANARAMVVLTDGRSNPDSPELALEAAAAAKAEGITVFTIGLGGELDFLALERMASKPEYFFEAPDAGQLDAIYGAIAVELPCPGVTFWAGR